MNMNAARTIGSTIFGLAMMAAISTASAEEGKRVDFADLDPNSSADVTMLYERINEAAELVCRQASSPWDGRRIRHFNECVQGAVDQAVQDIDLGSLTDLHNGSSEAKLAGR